MDSYRTGQWLGSPNCTRQRQGAVPLYVVLHTMVGTIASANDRFRQAAQQASAHYGVGFTGNIVQWVDEADGSWANGDWNMNMESITIEHEDYGFYDSPRPDALYTASAALVRAICGRYGIPISRSHVLDHRQVTQTSCPDALDTGRIIREAAAHAPVNPSPIDTEDESMSTISRDHENGHRTDWITGGHDPVTGLDQPIMYGHRDGANEVGDAQWGVGQGTPEALFWATPEVLVAIVVARPIGQPRSSWMSTWTVGSPTSTPWVQTS